MMIVSAEGDPGNADKFNPAEEIEDWRLIPNDNNIGLRDVRLEPGWSPLSPTTASSEMSAAARIRT